jgi:succinate dehydrogenase flavin-adding protein (antitoxin of CptAB toxin-antitoxin module)
MRYDDWKKEYDKLDDKSKKEYSNFLDTQADDYWGR